MQGNSRRTEKWNRDRRSGLRFPIDSIVDYKVLRQGRCIESGHGRTLNISSSGVLFEFSGRLTPGAILELSIAWPARLNDTAAMQLQVRGKAVRVEGSAAAVRISSYDFRTKARTANAAASTASSSRD